MTLYQEIQAKCTPQEIASGDLHAIAAKVSVGRTRPSGTLIGKGTVIKAIGLTAGNAFLDVVEAHADFRHVKHLLTAGELDASDALVPATVQSMVPAVLTQEQADALLALGVTADPVDWTAVQTALAQGA